MKAWSIFKARAVWLFGIALVLAGCLPVLYFIALLSSRFGVFQFLPEFQPAWLANLHIGLFFAALGAVVTPLGALVATRQKAAIAVEKRRREDRLRRVRQYREDDARLEPFIGSGIPTLTEEAPSIERKTAGPGRRVA